MRRLSTTTPPPGRTGSNPGTEPTSRRSELLKVLGVFCFIALAVPVSFGQNAVVTKPQPAATPAAVLDILDIQPFQLKKGYDHHWLESRPFVSDGLLVVLKVDPRHVVPRNTGEPVLYAGDVTVQRLNQGHGSGYVIGIIPGDIDLAAAPIWFGRPRLPERVTPKIIAEERALAESAGIEAFSPDKIAGIRRDVIVVEDLGALLRGPAGDRVLKYSPDERDLVDAWRRPAIGPGVKR